MVYMWSDLALVLLSRRLPGEGGSASPGQIILFAQQQHMTEGISAAHDSSHLPSPPLATRLAETAALWQDLFSTLNKPPRQNIRQRLKRSLTAGKEVPRKELSSQQAARLAKRFSAAHG